MNTLHKYFYNSCSLVLMLLAVFISSCTNADENSGRALSFDTALEASTSLQDAEGNDLGVTFHFVHQIDDTGKIIGNGQLFIEGLTNLCTATPPCTDADTSAIGTFIITASESFTLADDVPSLEFTILDQPGAATTSLSLGDVAFTRASDAETFTYAITVEYVGTDVNEIINALELTSIVSADFDGQALTVALADTNIIALSGATNRIFAAATIADGNEAPATGSITAISDSLPTGYELTAIDGTPYSIADPDDELIAEVTDEVLADISIAERDDDGNVVGINEVTYAVTLSLEALLGLETDDLELRPDITGAQLALSHDTLQITISGITNACAAPPCAEAGAAIGSLIITHDSQRFTIPADDNDDLEFAFPIPDQLGATNAASATIGTIDVTRVGDGAQFTYDVVADYSSIGVAELITTLGGITSIVSADFDGQALTVALADTNIIALSGATNRIFAAATIADGSEAPATGSITAISDSLPTGYELTAIDGTPYSIADPDDELIAEVTDEVLADISIAERDDDGNVVGINEVTYAVTLSLEALLGLETDDLELRPDITGAQLALSHDTLQITISGITNACAAPPCAEAGAAISSLIITHDSQRFTIPADDNDDLEFAFPIPDQLGATNAASATIGTIDVTRVGDGAQFTYDVVADYSSIGVAELVSSVGGIDAVLPADAVTATLGSQTTSDAEWISDVLIITNLIDPLGNEDDIAVSIEASDGGSTGLPSQDSPRSLLPAGYYFTPSSFIIPQPTDGASSISITDAITIAEGDETASPPTVIANNEISYDMEIKLDTSTDFILELADLELSFRDNYDGTLTPTTALATIASSALTLNSASKTLTVTAAAGISNFDGGSYGASGEKSGKLIITASTAGASKFVLTDTTLTFAEQDGTEFYTIDNLGTFTITNSGEELDYTVKLELATTYNVGINASYIAARQENKTIYISACEKVELVGAPFTISSDGTTNMVDGLTVTSTTELKSYHDNRPSQYLDTTSYEFDISDANGLILSTSTEFVANIALASCNIANRLFPGDGTVDSPWEITNDLRLDLMRSAISDNHSSYGSGYFILTADIDMGEPLAPWSEGSTYTPATVDSHPNGFIPIGRTATVTSSDLSDQSNQFKGHLDCQGYSISNLYFSNIDNTAEENFGGSYVGLFGVLGDGAVITNCVLVNPKFTGYQYVGGLAGYISSSSTGNVTITKSGIIGGSITAEREIVGGIAGIVEQESGGSSTFSSIFVAATVSADNFVGGLLGSGSSDFTLQNSYFVGSVTADGSGDSLSASGGMSAGTANLSNSYAAAVLTPSSVLGLAPDTATVTASYWDSTLNSSATGAGSGQSSSALQTPTSAGGTGEVYENWSSASWNFGTSSQYPVLIGFPLTAAEQCEAINAQLSTSTSCAY